jgi:arylsulfatase A-like enzyme
MVKRMAGTFSFCRPGGRSVLWVLSWLLAVVLISALRSANAAEGEKPERLNIVFLLADDLRWDAVGFMGNPIVETPNLDALATRGVVFENTFCTTSICCTSRASFLTGQYASRHGLWTFQANLLEPAFAKTFPAMLRSAGYHTGFIGKWGVGNEMPVDKFDYWAGFPGQGRYFARQGGKNAPLSKEHLHEITSRQIGEFFERRPEDKPFCLQVSFKTAHAQDGEPEEYPFEPRYASLYANVEIPPPPTATEEHYARLPEFLRNSEARRRWKPRFSNPELYQKHVKDYYRLVTGMDRVIGELVAELRNREILDRTLIVFTADNGYYLGDFGLADKWFIHEPSIRLPLLIVDPRLPAARQGARDTKTMALNIDFAPTFLDAAGLQAPAEMQGQSLLPLVRGENVNLRDEFFYEHRFQHAGIPKSEGVRDRKWKYVRYLVEPAPVEELFHLEADPLEERNLAGDEKYKEILEQYRQRCEQLRKEVQ